MVKFKGVILNNGVDEYGCRLSFGALKSMAKQLKNKPIGFEFNQSIPPTYGIVKSAEIKQGKVIVDAEVDKPNLKAQMFLVPGFEITASHQEGDVTVLDAVDLLAVSLTTQPVDKGLTPINWDN